MDYRLDRHLLFYVDIDNNYQKLYAIDYACFINQSYIVI